MPKGRYRSKAQRKNRKLATVGTVKRLIGHRSEDKYHQVKTTSSGTPVVDVPTLVHLSALSHGDTSITRDGDEVYLKSLSLRYHVRTDEALTNAGAVTDISNLVRVMLLQWKEQDTPVAADILQDATSIDALTSHYNWTNRRNFKVLYDRRHNLVPSMATGSSGSAGIVPARVNGSALIFGKKLAKKILYADSSSTGEKNGLYLMFISNSITNDPDIFYESRMVYSD